MANSSPICYGWETGAHIGREVFLSETDGMCVVDPDHYTYYLEANEKIYGGFTHFPTIEHLKRDMVVIVDGEERARYEVNPNYTMMWCNRYWYEKPPQRIIQFLLVDHDTEEVLFRREAIVNQAEEEEEPIPVPEDLTDYSRIKKGVESVVNESTSEIVDEILRASTKVDSLEGEVTDLGVWLNEEVEKQNKVFVSGVAGIKEKIGALRFPTIEDIKNMFLSLAEEFAEALWDRILDRIERRYEK